MFEFIERYISQKNVSGLLSILFLTLPFGSALVGLSIGFMTLYPSLIIIILLVIIGGLSKTKITNKTQKYTLVFYTFWLIYAIVQSLFLETKADAIIDIRSLILMLLFTYVIFWTSIFLTWSRWKKTVLNGVKNFFFLLFIFAFIEFQTGIHFTGNYTTMISKLEPSLVHYSPLFTYDNPNNFATYFILLGILILLIDKSYRQNKYKLGFIVISIFFIATIADARIGKIISLILIIYTAASIIISKIKANKKEQLKPALILLISIILVSFTPKFYGPIWQSSYLKQQGINAEDKKDKEDRLGSFTIRKNLAINGIEGLQKSNYVGVGPGQFRKMSKQKQFSLDTETNIGPHSWVIEIISQFGIVVFCGYCFIFFLIIKQQIKENKTNYKKFTIIVLSLFIFGLTSFLPSSFLILDINWLFLAILIVISSKTNKRINEY